MKLYLIVASLALPPGSSSLHATGRLFWRV